MEKAYALLGLDDHAGIEEIEKAYRNKKRLYDPARFVEGSRDRQFACARNTALDEAYRYASANARRFAASASPSSHGVHRQNRNETWNEERNSAGDSFRWGELLGLLFVCPGALFFIRQGSGAILADLALAGRGSGLRFLDAAVLLLSYLPPLLLRFFFLKRPAANLAFVLSCFPLTFLFADFLSSASLASFFTAYGFKYVPALYLIGMEGLFLLLYAHCAILRLSFDGRPRKGVPFFRRLAIQTLVLALSAGASVTLCAAFNERAESKLLRDSGLSAYEKTLNPSEQTVRSPEP